MLFRILFLTFLSLPFFQTSSAWSQTIIENQLNQKDDDTVISEQEQTQGTQVIDLTPSLDGIRDAILRNIKEDDRITAEAQQRREIRELQAQEEMARWASWMFYSAAATVALTLVALFAIYRTLHHTGRAANYTRDMLREAKATTRAAIETIEITREIGNRQVRPYITYDSGAVEVFEVEGVYPLGEKPNPKHLHLEVKLRNGGNSPGIVTAVSSAVYAPTGEEGWKQNGSSWRQFRMITGASQSNDVGFRAVDADKRGEFTVFAIGVIIWYEDLMGSKFEESFWLYFDGRELRQDMPLNLFDWKLYRPDDEQQ